MNYGYSWRDIMSSKKYIYKPIKALGIVSIDLDPKLDNKDYQPCPI